MDKRVIAGAVVVLIMLSLIIALAGSGGWSN